MKLLIVAALTLTSCVTTTPFSQLAPSLDALNELTANSSCAKYEWPSRGRAPAGYIKGMSLTFAKTYCQLKDGATPAVAMAKARALPESAADAYDVLSWYNSNFRKLGMMNDVSGAVTLRHLFTLQIGLGMRESSGRYCEGRDRSASNTSAETAEAGLFQTSWNARSASPEMGKLFTLYGADNVCFLDAFKEGVSCSAADLSNYGAGQGAEFQRISKACPAFAAQFAAVGMRTIRKHWGPLNRKDAEIRPECDSMLASVQAAIDAKPARCSVLR